MLTNSTQLLKNASLRRSAWVEVWIEIRVTVVRGDRGPTQSRYT